MLVDITRCYRPRYGLHMYIGEVANSQTSAGILHSARANGCDLGIEELLRDMGLPPKIDTGVGSDTATDEEYSGGKAMHTSRGPNTTANTWCTGILYNNVHPGEGSFCCCTRDRGVGKNRSFFFSSFSIRVTLYDVVSAPLSRS